MVFNSFNFIIIYPFIFLLYYAIPAKHTKGRNLYLLIASYFLYAQWKPVYALILLAVTAITFFSAKIITKASHPKQILTAGVLLTLLPLAFFKYFNFINETIAGILPSGMNFHLAGLN